MAPWRRASSSSAATVATSDPARTLVGNVRVSPEISAEDKGEADEGTWSALVPELLNDILRRVNDGAEWFPCRRDLVACAGVCRRWREASVALVRPPLEGGGITFPSSLKQPGPRDAPIQCFIKRDKETSFFYLYLSLTQALADEGKFLLAARRTRCRLHMEYVISVHSDDHSHVNHVGKLKSDLMRTKFTIYDLQPRREGAKTPKRRPIHLIASKQINPRISSGDVEIGQVSYDNNPLKTEVPRKMQCNIQYPAHKATMDPKESIQRCPLSSFVLVNKIPRWHDDLHLWCLDFNCRVIVASVKNFQLISTMCDQEVILQFGKIKKDVFTMDYRQPLSAFQAFAICLTSFGTKLSWQ